MAIHVPNVMTLNKPLLPGTCNLQNINRNKSIILCVFKCSKTVICEASRLYLDQRHLHVEDDITTESWC